MRITHATNDLFVGLDGIRLGFQQAMDGLELETECVFIRIRVMINSALSSIRTYDDVIQ